MVIKFKRSKNEAKMVSMFKLVRSKILNDFKIQPSQEWSYMLFSCSNEWRMKLKLFSCTYVYRMNLLRVFEVQTSEEWKYKWFWGLNECKNDDTMVFMRKWVKNEPINGFKV